MAQSKEPIRLRQREVSNGRISLYLDIYVSGKRSYEYLHLYLIPEHSRQDKEKNRETLRLAEAIKAKRIVELRNGIYGFANKGRQVPLMDFIDSVIKEKTDGGHWSVVHSLVILKKYIARFCGEDVTMDEIDKKFCKAFRNFLDTTDQILSVKGAKMAQNTKALYWTIWVNIFNVAIAKEVIASNPNNKVEGFRHVDAERCYLTLQELKKLVNTPAEKKILARAFLFSCFTGLRLSDIQKMKWSEVTRNGDRTRITYRQKKTKKQEYYDISDQAVVYMGERGDPDELVFKGLKYTCETGMHLQRWAMHAGIDKPITFHSGRHTFAVIMLELGVDLYTVQKLLGHSSMNTTMIYAKILDKQKQAAVDKIPDLKI